MNETAEADQRFLALCQEVRRRAMLIYGQAGTGKTEEASVMAIELADFVSTARQQALMQQEAQAGAYDLAALKVDATASSNSETGWERED